MIFLGFLNLLQKMISIINQEKTTGLPILNASIENFGLGEKLNVGEFTDSQAFKLFREQCEHIEAFNLLEAIFLGDTHIYRDTLKCMSNFIIANPSIRDDLEKLIKDKYNDSTKKRCLYSNLVDSNEIICIHSDELMFPAHLESCPAVGSFAIRMDNPCLVKVITFSSNLSKDSNKENKDE